MRPDLDAVLQATCPAIMVPRYGRFEPLSAHGHRFLTATDGLHVEIRRPWLHAILPVAESIIPLPYGSVEPCVRLRLHGLVTLVEQFIAEAARISPHEHAAWFAIDSATGILHYESISVVSQSAEHIQYRRPPMNAGAELAVDIHSHGRAAAGFSDDDDADSIDDAKLEIVVGNLDRDVPTMTCRLSVLGLRIDYSEWLAAQVYRR